MEAKLQQQAPQKALANKPNLTGIPTQMKLDFEQRSGLSFDDVRVHYNSDKPAQLQALAYTQGTQVYVGPGQERHLPHELGHVVQQKHENIKADTVYNGVPINTSQYLEHLANSNSINYRAKENISKYPRYINTSVIQLQPQKGGTKKRDTFDEYYKNMDPEDAQAEFDTDKQLRQKPVIGKRKRVAKKKIDETIPFAKERVPTFYTYRHLKPTASLNTTMQGPHTVAHRYIYLLMELRSWHEIYKKLIEPYDAQRIQEIIGEELGLMISDTDGEDIIDKSAATKPFERYEEYISTYKSLYDFLCNSQGDMLAVDSQRQIDKKNVTMQQTLVGRAMMSIIEMHPYSSYSWNRSFPENQKPYTENEIAGKGETQIDLGNIKSLQEYAIDKHADFKNMDEYISFLGTRFYFLDLASIIEIDKAELEKGRKNLIKHEYNSHVKTLMHALNTLNLNPTELIKCIGDEDLDHYERVLSGLNKARYAGEDMRKTIDEIRKYQELYAPDVIPQHLKFGELIMYGITSFDSIIGNHFVKDGAGEKFFGSKA